MPGNRSAERRRACDVHLSYKLESPDARSNFGVLGSRLDSQGATKSGLPRRPVGQPTSTLLHRDRCHSHGGLQRGGARSRHQEAAPPTPDRPNTERRCRPLRPRGRARGSLREPSMLRPFAMGKGMGQTASRSAACQIAESVRITTTTLTSAWAARRMSRFQRSTSAAPISTGLIIAAVIVVACRTECLSVFGGTPSEPGTRLRAA